VTAFILILLALALIGTPLFVIVGAATALCFYLLSTDLASTRQTLMIVQSMEQLLTQKQFLAIPLFMASGAIMTAGGIATRLVNVAKAALGWLPGGVAVASVVACMFFAAISGSSPVTLIAVGSIMFPAMVESKYPENFALGLVTTAGSLGCLVPPSISMLIYAITVTGTRAKVDPRDLFLAGLLPALFISGLLAIYSIRQGLKIPGSRIPFSARALWAAIVDGIWALLLPVIVLGGIYGGFYNASEAGAVATGYALVVTMLVYRELGVRKLFDTLVESATLMGSLILIIVLAFGLNKYLADIQVDQKLMGWIQSMNLGPSGFLLLVNVVLIVIGALMDSISCTLIFAPMLAPVAYELYGIDPIHFGVVFVVNMEIGYLMPPVATNLFVSSAVFKKPFGQVTRAVMPTLTITCLALGVLMYVPTISKAAVNWKDGRAIYEPFPWHPKKAAVAEVEEVDGIVKPKEPDDAPKGGIDMASLTASAFADDDDDGDAGVLDAGPKAAANWWDCEGESGKKKICAANKDAAKTACGAKNCTCIPSDDEAACSP
jgi:C4-dicarboxylate transporter DctM subunit